MAESSLFLLRAKARSVAKAGQQRIWSALTCLEWGFSVAVPAGHKNCKMNVPNIALDVTEQLVGLRNQSKSMQVNTGYRKLPLETNTITASHEEMERENSPSPTWV